ncbi:biotin transporter BioY [candidate division WOR-3 bacterium]|nr:biotin transporter BioY [candidate division WOR-3 bacterium]
MNITKTINYLEYRKEAYYTWLYDLAWTKRLFLSLVMAGITGIAAQIRIPLLFTPVPVTGQILAVLLSGILLGKLYGGLSMVFYLLIGFAGVPWFSGLTYGLPIGPTTGYIIGFIPAALFIGWITERFKITHHLLSLIGIMMTAVLIVYFFGALHLAIFMKTSLKQTMIMAVLPFIPVDILKAFIAAGIARAFLPSSQ